MCVKSTGFLFIKKTGFEKRFYSLPAFKTSVRDLFYHMKKLSTASRVGRVTRTFVETIMLIVLVSACGPGVALAPDSTETPVASTASLDTSTQSPASEFTSDLSIEDVTASLQGLSLEEFFEESYAQLQMRDPDMGIYFPECYVTQAAAVTDLSDAYLRDTQQLEINILSLLRDYDSEDLPPDQQLSYSIYEWYLDDLVRGHEFMYSDFPINGYGSWDIANRFVDAMLILPVEDEQDAEDYISRLVQVDTWIEQLQEGLQLRQQAGVIPPRFMLEDAVLQIEDHMQMLSSGEYDIDAILLLTSFDDRLQPLGGLNGQEKEDLLEAAREEIEQTFIPAFTELRDTLVNLEDLASEEGGLSSLPDGEAYYAHLLRRYTGTTLSADELNAMGRAQVADLQAEIREVAVALGYAADISMAEINQILDENAGSLEGDDLLAEYERLLAEAESAASNFFGLQPSAEVVITYEPAGFVPAYYRNPPLDGSGPGQMVVNLQNPGTGSLYNEISLLNHESIPGHHMQLALTLDLNLPTFRTTLCSDVYLKDIEFQAYVEGWAMYAQQLGWEMGIYEDDSWKNLNRLRLMLNQSARMVVDTGIHAMGWSRADAAIYFEEATGRPTSVRQMNRYVALPGQAVSYNFGMLAIMRLRQQAMDQLGASFEIKEFHDLILGAGPVPAGFLEELVNDWIESKLRP